MLSAALYFAAALATSTSTSCSNFISCPCGISNNKYTFCIDGSTAQENPCVRWSQCETCQEGYAYCLTCPSGRSGELCTKDQILVRRKRKYGRPSYTADYQYRTISCVQQDYFHHGKALVHTITGAVLQDSDDLLYPVGTKLRYSCNPGLSLVGKNVLVCEQSGFWSTEAPKCIAKTSCVAQEKIVNGFIIVHTIQGKAIKDPGDSHYPVGTELEYACYFGYQISGNSKLRCEESGFWSALPPACVKACGKSIMEPNHKVTNGKRTIAGEWPWMVAISVYSNGYPTVICGGALLDRRTVLSAAHCVSNSTAKYVLQFGKYYRRNVIEEGLEHRNVARIIRHEKYNAKTFENDIALLKLESAVPYTEKIQPICLPTPRDAKKDLIPGNKGYLTGYGVTELNLMADDLLMARLKVQPDKICNETYIKDNVSYYRRSGMFCAGFKEGVTSACRADSGSPFVFYNKQSHSYTLEGCVSFNTRGQCGQPGKFTVFTRIANYISWIKKNRWRRF